MDTNEIKKENKSKKVLVFLICIIGIAMIGIGCFLVVNSGVIGNYMNSNDDKKSGPKKDKKTSKPKEPDNVESEDLKAAKELLKYFGFYENIACGRNIYSSSYSDEFKRSIAFKNVDSSNVIEKKCSDLFDEVDLKDGYYFGENGTCKEGETAKTYSYDSVNEVYKKMYGSDIPKDGFDTLKISGLYYNFYDYVDKTNTFIKLSCNACGGACGGATVTVNKIKSVDTKDDKYIIEVYYLHSEFIRNNKKYQVTTPRGKIDLQSDNVDDAKIEIENNYLKKLDVYKVTFNKDGNDYVFASVVKE